MHLYKRVIVITTSCFVAAGVVWLSPAGFNGASQSVAAACSATAPTSNLGQVSQTITVASAGSYRVWSRMKAADASANSYFFRVDTGCTYNIGDASSISASDWSWVNYQDASSGSPVDVNLTAGEHTFTFTGKESGVQVDKIMLLGDASCVPTGLGDNCGVVDVVSPVATLTSPVNNAVVNKGTTMSAAASDAGGVTKVEFYVNGQLVGTDTTAPYSYDLDTTSVANGLDTFQVKAYDGFNNVGSSANSNVTVTNDPKVSQYRNLLNGKTFTTTTPNNTTESGNPVTNVNDMNDTTRWISAPVDNAAITTDLGASTTLGKVSMYWAGDTVKDYDLQLSADNSTWKTVYTGVTNNTQRQLVDITTFTSSPTGRYLRVVAKDRWNPAFGNSLWEIGAYASATNPPSAPPTSAPDGGEYLSDVLPALSANGWGPYERDMSNGEKAAADGHPLTLNGTVYAKGLGVHAPGTLTYALDGKQTTFKADIGIDDEAGTYNGLPSVTFSVWGDGTQLYKSTEKGADSPVESITVNVSGVKKLELKLDPGSGNSNDKSDWASARVLPGGLPTIAGTATVTPPATPGDTVSPVAAITAPANGTSLVGGSSVTVTANATDNVGVTKVDFLVDGTVITSDAAAPYSYALNTTGMVSGAHSLVVKAYDAAGNGASSAAVSFTVTNATTATIGDVNGDGRVNALDLSSLISHDGQNYSAADFNKDGTVGAADLAILLAKWTW